MERFFRQVYNFSPRGHIKSESLGKEMKAMSQKNNKPCNEFGSQQAQQKGQSKQANGKNSGSGVSGKSNSEFSSNNNG